MSEYARYELQFILADGKHIDCPEVVARSQAEAEAYALGTIGPTMEFAAAIVGVWYVDSEPVLLATPQKATNDIIAALRAALKRQAERHGEPLPLVYFRGILAGGEPSSLSALSGSVEADEASQDRPQ
jgi:hypothetical protein